MVLNKRSTCCEKRGMPHHCNVVVLSNNMSDPLQLLIQVVGPNLTYSLAVIHSSSGHSAASTYKALSTKGQLGAQVLTLRKYWQLILPLKKDGRPTCHCSVNCSKCNPPPPLSISSQGLSAPSKRRAHLTLKRLPSSGATCIRRPYYIK